MKPFNIYLCGVGGQGIGMLSEILLRAADHSGQAVIGVDTHGLAQRGGIVVSRIRIGERAHSPLIQRGHADLVMALERLEAFRAAVEMLRKGGTLLYYNTSWQSLDVRLGNAPEMTEADLFRHNQSRDIRTLPVEADDMVDTRMQNTALLREAARHALIPGVEKRHYLAAMKDLMQGPMLEANRRLFST